MRAFSLDLRERVLSDYLGGMTFAAIGRKFTVSAEWVRLFVRRHEATGEVAARPTTPKRQPFHRRHEAQLRAAVAENHDLTLEKLRERLGLEVSLATLWNALRALKISSKKKRSSPRSSRAPTSRPPATSCA